MIKLLPLKDLNVIAVAMQVDIFENEDTGAVAPIFDLEPLDDAAFERFQKTGVSFDSKGMRCDCCNQRLKYACIVEHRPTAEFYRVGRDCARTIEILKPWTARLEGVCVSLAQRAACNEREATFRAAHPEAVAALEWARTGVNRTAADISSKLRSYGLSDAQRTFLVKLHADDTARRATATGTAPTGKTRVEGAVLSVKVVTNPPRGRWGGETYTAKVLVDLGNGAKVYGNAPGACLSEEHPGNVCTLAKGDRVAFSATFEPSDRDPLFGFWKRPTKWEKIVPADLTTPAL